MTAAGVDELSLVETIAGVEHTMMTQKTGCVGDPTGPLSEEYVVLLAEWVELPATEL